MSDPAPDSVPSRRSRLVGRLPGAASRWARGAHRLFWWLLVPVLPAVGAALSAGGGAPRYALESAWVYRLEVWLAFYFGLFVVGLLLHLGYHGRTFRRLELPGGAALELDPAGLDEAADGFAAFRRELDAALEAHEGALGDLDDRLAAVEDGGDGGL